ncbi:odorant receptor 43a-like [Mycetomoellerius zeteki]|uniref:odorant receptor 43a-like n=1 Tax=Mycetomoellerius zeteki TaxID=64791 RepID=UPI00084EB555|nr:PREDICTED: odorant receptor 43a-like [Trachymyrmex zeteki]
MTIAFTFVVVLPICGISIRYLTNVTDPEKLLPLQTYYPYDVSKRPQYELTFFIQSIAIFFAILSYTGIDNFLGLLLIEKGNNISITHLTYEVCILVNTFGHMCVYCAVGEILVAQCDQIHRAVYNYKWYTLEPRSAKCLIVLLIRSNKSSYLTAGKVFPMTMATFCNLIKTSASYISVLLTTRT